MHQTHSLQLLLVEDDQPLAELIADFLSEDSIQVQIANTASQALMLCHSHSFDIIVCDLMLPDMHGFELAPKLRLEQNCPLLFLTALGDDESHIQGLNMGATDFITKPVRPAVLLARIKSSLRKQLSSTQEAQVSLGNYVLDYRSKVLKRDGVQIPITNQEFDILWLFVCYPSGPISREFMFRKIIGRPYDGSDRAADLRVSRLRKKLEESGCRDIAISTIRGQGYILTIGSHA